MLPPHLIGVEYCLMRTPMAFRPLHGTSITSTFSVEAVLL
jgi:hypothetical protein